MIITECNKKEDWIEPKTSSFLQSWDWGEFKASVGQKVLRIQLKDQDRVVAQVQGTEEQRLFGIDSLYIPKYISTRKEHDMLFFDYLKKRGYTFIRVEPEKEFDSISYYSRPIKNRQPKQTHVLSIVESEEVLLENMHSKTRYNIRLAKRKGVEVKKEKNSEIFWQLNKETTNRDAFRSHDKIYYEKMIASDMITQFVAYFNNTPISTILCVGFGNRFTYLHGASSNAHRNVMSPYVIQWQAIQYAKENGFSEYDFGGVAPLLKEGGQCFHNACWNKHHKWSGITRFKVGFGGAFESYPKAVEIVFKKKWYSLFSLIRWIVSKIR